MKIANAHGRIMNNKDNKELMLSTKAFVKSENFTHKISAYSDCFSFNVK